VRQKQCQHPVIEGNECCLVLAEYASFVEELLYCNKETVGMQEVTLACILERCD
jgi:hypothetical protein